MVSGLDGWHNVRLIPASNAHETRGLDEIAVMVERGVMPGDTPIFVATKRTDAPYPDVVVAVPITVAELRAWVAGDRSVARDIVEALDMGYGDFMRQVRENKIE